MSLQLYLVRHADAHAPDRGMEDFERPLSDRGRSEAALMAREFAQRLADSPPALLSSPAVRAITTARRFADALGIDGRTIRIDARLFEASAGDWMRVLAEQPDAVTPLLAFGHNPGISELTRWLCPELQGVTLPTASCAGMHLAIPSWGRIDRDCGHDPVVVTPREVTRR